MITRTDPVISWYVNSSVATATSSDAKSTSNSFCNCVNKSRARLISHAIYMIRHFRPFPGFYIPRRRARHSS